MPTGWSGPLGWVGLYLDGVVNGLDDELLRLEVLHLHVNLVQVVVILHPETRVVVILHPETWFVVIIHTGTRVIVILHFETQQRWNL